MVARRQPGRGDVRGEVVSGSVEATGGRGMVTVVAARRQPGRDSVRGEVACFGAATKAWQRLGSGGGLQRGGGRGATEGNGSDAGDDETKIRKELKN